LASPGEFLKFARIKSSRIPGHLFDIHLKNASAKRVPLRCFSRGK